MIQHGYGVSRLLKLCGYVDAGVVLCCTLFRNVGLWHPPMPRQTHEREAWDLIKGQASYPGATASTRTMACELVLALAAPKHHGLAAWALALVQANQSLSPPHASARVGGLHGEAPAVPQAGRVVPGDTVLAAVQPLPIPEQRREPLAWLLVGGFSSPRA